MRILLATHVCPFPARSGGQLRTRQLLEALQGEGEVDLLVMKNDYNRDALASGNPTVRAVVEEPGLQHGAGGELARRIAYHRDAGRRLLEPSGKVVAEMRRQVEPGNYDLIVARYLRTVLCCGLLPGPVPVAVDVDDYQPALLRARIPQADPLTRFTLRRQLRFSEARLADALSRAAHLWVSLPEDRNHSPLQRATVLPNLPFTYRETEHGDLPAPSAPDHFGMIGTWTYSANAHGLRWFLRKVWPHVLRRRPHARLVLAGSAPGRLRRFASAQSGIDWLGRVDDPAELYARAAVFLAPVLFGAGTNIKVLEGAAFGRPGVVTPVAMRGFRDTLGRGGGLREAGDPRSFAGAMLAWAEDPAAAREAGEKARKAVLRSYTTRIFKEAVREGVRKALA